jgi:tetratricopeptide (TPR) repeat protein
MAESLHAQHEGKDMTEGTERAFDDFNQEADDLIDAAVEDPNPARAVKRLERAMIRGFPEIQLASAYMVLGTRYEDLGDEEKAIECYTKSLELDAANAIVLFWRGGLRFRRGDYSGAKADLEKTLSIPEPSGLVWPDRDTAQEYIDRIVESGAS